MTSIRKFLPLIILGLVAVLIFSMCGAYNKVVVKDESVKKAWSQVENQYQRRADLIPNLVNTVKGYANFEQQTLTDVIQARASATQVKIDPENLTPENIQRFEQAQQGLSGALGRLLMVTENYPNLKANENFMALQQQLEGTENRITVARNRYIQSVQDYNGHIRQFPTNLTAKIFGYDVKPNFTVENEAAISKPPVVEFEPAKPAPAPAK